VGNVKGTLTRKKGFQINKLGDAFGHQYEPLTYLNKFLIDQLKATILKMFILSMLKSFYLWPFYRTVPRRAWLNFLIDFRYAHA
jgi:hypothetical protein